jgi:hypothetical protein
VNHRRGQRWQTDLVIRIAVDHTITPVQVRLQDLSLHGARVRLCGIIKPGKTIAVWLPHVEEPIRALVIHRHGDSLGLLWIEHSPWVEHTLMNVVSESQQPMDDSPIIPDTPNSAPKLAVSTGRPQTLLGATDQKTQRRA